MPDEVKVCRFYHFLKCGETNCCNCPYHPLQNTGSARVMIAANPPALSDTLKG